MKYVVRYTKRALQDLEIIDPPVAARIFKKIKFFGQQTNPLRFAKRLSDALYGQYRFRVGDYRIFFDLDRKGEITVLFVLHVRHRREAYT